MTFPCHMKPSGLEVLVKFEICTVLGIYAAQNYRVRQSKKNACPLKMGPIGCPETSTRKYLLEIPKQHRSHLLRGGSLESSSSSLAQQPDLSPGLPQKLPPAILVPCSIPPVFLPQLPGIIHHAVLPSQLWPTPLPFSFYYCSQDSFAGLCSSNRITCPAHLRRLTFIYMYVTISLSLYNVYSSWLYFIPHSPF